MLVIANTLCQQHNRWLYTWISPDSTEMTDYIFCSWRWRSSIQLAKTRRGADCGSYHELLIANFRLKLKYVGKTTTFWSFSSVQFSHSVVSDSLRPQGLQHARLPCPPPSPGVCSNSCPLTQWWHPTISSSVVPISSCPQSFPASGSFLISWLFASGGQSSGALASASVLPINIQGWFPLQLTSLTLWCPRDSQESSPTPHLESISSSVLSLLMVQLSHPYMTTGETIALTRQTFVGKVMTLLFNMLSRLDTAFLTLGGKTDFGV